MATSETAVVQAKSRTKSEPKTSKKDELYAMNLHRFTNISKILERKTAAQLFEGYPLSKVYIDFVLLLSQ